jgi:signal transduction histidine kinase
MSGRSRWLGFAGLLLLVVVGAVVLTQLLLEPADRREWFHYAYILVGPALAAAVLLPLINKWVSHRTSVSATVFFVGVCSITLGTVTSSAASNAMFLSAHDYRLFLVVLALTGGIALAAGWYLTRPLTAAIARLGDVASRVSDGDLDARSGIDRHDEIGRAAQALDGMVLRLAEAAEDRLERQRTRQHLFTSVSHDLRTPLSAMKAAVEALEDGLIADPSRYLGVIHRQLDTVHTMIDQLVEWSRLESGHERTSRQRVSMSEIADECVEALGPLAGRQAVRLRCNGSGPALLDADPDEMSRLIRNLVDNALRFAPPESEVAVDVAESSVGVRVDVVDAGPGFPAEFRQVAFDPFQRADPSRNARTGNAGLGLAICKAIVTAHGGTIGIVDAPFGHVTLSLPKVAG